MSEKLHSLSLSSKDVSGTPSPTLLLVLKVRLHKKAVLPLPVNINSGGCTHGPAPTSVDERTETS